MQFGEFLQFVWSSAIAQELPGSAVVWTKQRKESIHVDLAAVAAWDDEDHLDLLDSVGLLDAYTSPGLRRPGLVDEAIAAGDLPPQGGARDVVALAGFVLDIDLASDVAQAHKAKNLPAESDVAAILAGAPDPTLVVNSGYGLQPWWLFDEVVLASSNPVRAQLKVAFKKFQSQFIVRAAAQGFHLDDTATIQHVFRLPGTRNWKLESSPRDVEVIYLDANNRYPIEQLSPGWQSASPVVSVPVTVAAPVPAAPANSIERVVQSLKQIRPDHEHAGKVKALLEGRSFARRGERNAAMHKLVWVIANRGRGLPPEELAEIFRPSLSVWAAEEDAQKTLEEEMEVVTSMFERDVGLIEDEDRKKAKEAAAVYQGLLRIRDRAEPRATEESEESAPSLGVPTTDDVKRAAIIQWGTSYWVFSFALQDRPLPRGYHGPLVKDEVLLRCKDSWQNAEDFGYELSYIVEKTKKVDGESVTVEEEKQKTLPRVLHEYGSSALDVVSELALQESYFDLDERVFHEAVFPLRKLEPRYDEQIQYWLLLLGGGAGNGGERVVDWVSCLPRLDKACCALYLEGPPDCGKNLLANGIARLYRTTGPSSFVRTMGNFNADALSRGGCPIIQLNEGLPKSATATSAFIRDLVSAVEHTSNQKNKAMRKVLGAIRLLITANNDNILSQIAGEDLTEDDISATVDRFLHVRAPQEATDWLRANNAATDKQLTASWVEGDLMARHVLWLAENWTITRPGKRFLVDGEPAEIHRALVTRGDRRGAVLEWLARFMTDPSPVETFYKTKRQYPLAYVGNGKLLVNTQALLDCWGRYTENTMHVKLAARPSPTAIGQALGQISDGKLRPRINGDDTRIRYHRIKTDYVLSWADGDAQVGDLGKMLANLNRQIEEPDEGPTS